MVFVLKLNSNLKRQVRIVHTQKSTIITLALVAPNQYAPEQCNLFDTTPEYTFGFRTNIEPNSITPAPNTYAPEKVRLDEGPSYTMRPKVAVEKPNNVPGRVAPLHQIYLLEVDAYSRLFIIAPGAYDVEKFQLDNGPSYTMRPKTGKDKFEDTPAPNAYKPDVTSVKENTPAFQFGIRPEIKVKNETPGK